MAHLEQTLRKKFEQTIRRHRRSATAASYFALGSILAEAFELSDALGKELSDGLGDPIACWRRCVKLAPRHVDAWRRLGQAFYERGDHASAARALKHTVKLQPHDASAWNNLAVLTLPAPGEDDPARVRRAERYLRRAIEEDPRGKKLGFEPYAWLAELAERRRDDPGALTWYAEAHRRGDRYAGARKQVIEGHGARRRATTPSGAAPLRRARADRRAR